MIDLLIVLFWRAVDTTRALLGPQTYASAPVEHRQRIPVKMSPRYAQPRACRRLRP